MKQFLFLMLVASAIGMIIGSTLNTRDKVRQARIEIGQIEFVKSQK